MTKWQLHWIVAHLARALAKVLHWYADKHGPGAAADRSAAYDLERYADDIDDVVNRERDRDLMTEEERDARHALECGPSRVVYDRAAPNGYRIEHSPAVVGYLDNHATAIVFGPPEWRAAAMAYAKTGVLP